MGRSPLAIGTWGLVRTYSVGHDDKGKPKRHKAVADYHDFDGVVRRVQASGRSVTQATQNLRAKLQNRTLARRHGDLTMMTRFSAAADLWLSKLDDMVLDGRRSPGTVETYRRQLKNHILPALGEPFCLVGAADSHREVWDACPVHQIVARVATSEPPPFQLERRARHEGEKDTRVPPPR